ncbi:DUF4252 domain-containing protein [Elongatibacter sediminis]|uniref:DUF4252 domain-containing protein n=1 Tax=Elongatibacter sediminis TaxID=3119006 RepID=A0AAW9RKZ2_9GAMM
MNSSANSIPGRTRCSALRRSLKRLSLQALIVVAIVFSAGPALAQEDALKDLPGYVDFGELGALFGEPTVQISVGESLLNLVGLVSASEDPEVASLFKRLKGVRVNVFETSRMPDGAVPFVRDVSSRLSAGGWESVVTVNSAEEQVRIFMKITGGTVEGITVMAVEEDEAAFINVIGNINPADLERVMDNFDVDLGNGVAPDEG